MHILFAGISVKCAPNNVLNRHNATGKLLLLARTYTHTRDYHIRNGERRKHQMECHRTIKSIDQKSVRIKWSVNLPGGLEKCICFSGFFSIDTPCNTFNWP